MRTRSVSRGRKRSLSRGSHSSKTSVSRGVGGSSSARKRGRSAKRRKLESLRGYLSGDGASSSALPGIYYSYAPVFFGFYAYFGTIKALEEQDLLPSSSSALPLLGATGASAGAMASSMLSNIACFPGKLDLDNLLRTIGQLKFSEVCDFYPPPLMLRGGLMRGLEFENIMNRCFPSARSPITFSSLRKSPLSVTVYDILGKGLLHLSPSTSSSMAVAKAVRASATFPGLLSPVLHDTNPNSPAQSWLGGVKKFFRGDYALLLDGGIGDVHGTEGLKSVFGAEKKRSQRRVIHVVASSLNTLVGLPSPKDLDCDELLSVVLVNTPKCGPAHMKNGPVAIEAARVAFTKALDENLVQKGEGWYTIKIDCSP